MNVNVALVFNRSYAAIIGRLKKKILKGPPRALKAPQREPSKFLTLRYIPRRL